MIRKNKLKQKKAFHTKEMLPKAQIALATACLLGGELSAQTPIDVDGNSNLQALLNAATPSAHSFRLVDDVTLNNTFESNNANRQNIVIDGNNHKIIRTSQNNLFQVGQSGTTLTITNATITSSAASGSGNAAIWIDGNRADTTLNLDGTTFTGNRSDGAFHAAGIATRSANTIVNGDVSFVSNYATGYASAGVSVGTAGSSLTFTGRTTFTDNVTTNRSGAASVNPNSLLTFQQEATFARNSTDTRAGALWVDNGGIATFQSKATFTGNHTKIFGGAINVEYGAGRVIFQDDVTFTGNYARGNDGSGARGGAVSLGTGGGSDNATGPQLVVNGRAEFDGNYVWAETNHNSYGGAIAVTVDGNPVNDNGGQDSNHTYRVEIEQGAFTNNYAYSETAGQGYGGAIFSKSYKAELSFGNGSEFVGNAATGQGGAIYFGQGTITLTGNVLFEGNRQNATFTAPATGAPVLNANSGSSNAIYFAAVSNQAQQTATLSLRTGAGERITFNDAIESAAGRIVTVEHSGDGEVVFSGNASNILANTTFDSGTFALKNGASYGVSGATEKSVFEMNVDTALKGDRDTTLVADEFNLYGLIESTEGKFNFEGGDLLLASTSTILIHIFGDGSNSYIDIGERNIDLNGAKLQVEVAANYVPAQEPSDTFTIVARHSGNDTGLFAGDGIVQINGADFQIVYGETSIFLQQITVPEPSTYAMLLAIGCVGFAWARRQKKNGKALQA